jgi:ferredoxin
LKKYKATIPDGTSVDLDSDINLRTALKKYWDQIYNKPFQTFHCRGLGTCGTCAIKIDGELTPPTKMEKWRLNFPPHKDGLAKGLRLACQCLPLGDIEIKKGGGKWGQDI